MDTGVGCAFSPSAAFAWFSVDLSTDSIELCASESSARKNVGLIQADLYNLPFPQEHFDNIFSFGVLHHISDTKTALGHVAKHLKPGGNISIYVYPESRLVETYRKVTTKLPTRLFYWLSVFHNYLIMSWMRHLGPIGRIYTRLMRSGNGEHPYDQSADLDHRARKPTLGTTTPNGS